MHWPGSGIVTDECLQHVEATLCAAPKSCQPLQHLVGHILLALGKERGSLRHYRALVGGGAIPFPTKVAQFDPAPDAGSITCPRLLADIVGGHLPIQDGPCQPIGHTTLEAQPIDLLDREV